MTNQWSSNQSSVTD